MDPITKTVVLLAISAVVYPLIEWAWQRYRLPVQVARITFRLRGLPFFHQLYVGGHCNHELPAGYGEVHSDAPYMVAVTEEDRLIGVIGFDLKSGSLRVYQLQGIKGVNVKGIDLHDYLLTCAEAIALALGKRTVKVLLARRNFYYELTDDHSLYPQLLAHQRRLEKIYNLTPRNKGYKLTADMGWHAKHLA